jgi:aspartokinase
VEPSVANIAKDVVLKEFELEIMKKLVDCVTIQDDLSVIAVIGENMSHTPGVAGIYNIQKYHSCANLLKQ